MPLSTPQKHSLFSLLELNGWTWRDDIIYAPRETMWLTRDEPWVGDVVEFYERMVGRRSRINGNQDRWDTSSAFADVDSLVAALEKMQPNQRVHSLRG